jgi:predicted anti-sigma-YlaC factor YlaD
MNGCERHEVTLSALIDGELEPVLLLPALDHLVECESCRAFFRDSRRLGDRVLETGLPRHMEEAPEPVWRQIQADRAARTARPSVRTLWTGWVGRAAAVLLVGVAVWILATAPRQQGGPVPGGLAEMVVLEKDRGRMSNERFIELTTELLQADRSYHIKMLEVIRLVSESFPEQEGPSEQDPLVPREDFDQRFIRDMEYDGGEALLTRGGDRS